MRNAENPSRRAADRTCRRAFRAALAFLLVGTTCARAGGRAGLEPVESFGENPGDLRLYTYVPENLEADAPLVVVAHGCLQTAADVAAHSGWRELADRHGFALLFPETDKTNEPFAGCFRTWLPEHQARGAGEPLSIRNQLAWALNEFDADPKRVYMTGQSSGGLVTSVMLASYPELFAAGAVQSAYPYRCANAFEDLAPCSQALRAPPDGGWGDLVRAAAPAYSGPRPRIALWHGGDDPVIVPANLDLQIEQWADVLDLDTDSPANDETGGQVRRRFAGTDGTIAIEAVLLPNLVHAIAVDPDGTPPCGNTAPYFVDADACAAYRIGQWFGVVP